MSYVWGAWYGLKGGRSGLFATSVGIVAGEGQRVVETFEAIVRVACFVRI